MHFLCHSHHLRHENFNFDIDAATFSRCDQFQLSCGNELSKLSYGEGEGFKNAQIL